MENYYNQLVHYIQQHLQHGTPVEIIRQSLIEAGWDGAMVDQALQTVLQAPAVQPSGQQEQHSTLPAVKAPQKYKVFRALSDTVQAIQHNTKAFLISGITVFIIAYAVVFVLGLITTAIISNAIGSGFSVMGLIVIYVTSMVLSTTLSALVQIVGSVTLYDGREGRKTNLKQLLATCRHKFLRVIGANILLGLAVAGPLIVSSLLGLILSFASRGSDHSSPLLLMIVLLMGLVGSAWMIIAVVRYALVPLVAVFENIPLPQTLARSNFLLSHGGKWFIFKGFLLFILIALVLSAVTGQNLENASNSTNPVLVVLLLLSAIMANGGLIMLYHNRRIVREPYVS